MFHTAGGTVFASCSAGQATLTRRIPAQGYQTDGYSRGPATSVWAKFQNGGTEQTVTVTCAGDHPRLVTAPGDEPTGGGGPTGGGETTMAAGAETTMAAAVLVAVAVAAAVVAVAVATELIDRRESLPAAAR